MLSKIKTLSEDKRVQNIIFALWFIVSVIIFVTLQYGIGVDYDESFTWDLVVCKNFPEMIRATAEDVHPPLYYLIGKLFVAVFGASIQTLLWDSVVQALLTCILSWVYVRKNWGWKCALLFNTVVLFAPYQLHYNLNMRMYSLMNLLAMGVIFLSLEVIKEGKTHQFVLLYVFSILSVYTQYFAVLPVVVCYVWLAVIMLKNKDFKKFRSLFIVGALDVITFFPWMIYGMKNLGIGPEGRVENYRFKFTPWEIVHTFFKCNLENYEIIAMIVLALALVCFILTWKRFSGTEQSFLVMLIINSIFCIYVSQWIGSLNGHDFGMRYIIYVYLFFWLFMIFVFSRAGSATFTLLAAWALVLCLSSYRVEHAYEYDTTPLMPKTMAFIEENISPDDLVVYDYNEGFYMIWKYYMPENELLSFFNMDLEEMRGRTFWFLNLNGTEFSKEDMEKYGITVEKYPDMGFMGMERFDFWKVTVAE